MRWVWGRMAVTDRLHGERFWVTETDAANDRTRRIATPLLLALGMIECADPFIVYTSNIFATLAVGVGWSLWKTRQPA